MIYHITTKSEWEAALAKGEYAAPSLKSEGFIHLCSQEQIAGVIERYYRNAQNLVLLHVNENKLTTPPVYELSSSVNEKFPHIYGTIVTGAVEQNEPVQWPYQP